MVAEVLDYTDVDLTEVKTWLNDTFWLNWDEKNLLRKSR
jgi:hypothetical protein